MTLGHLLNVEWFGYLVIVFLAVSILKNGYELVVFLINEFAHS